jgi:hypothetical protein
MMKQNAQEKQRLLGVQGFLRNADKQNLSGAKQNRNYYFAAVKSNSRRSGQTQISVINTMKAPQKRHFVRQDVPEVKCVIG